MALEAVSVLSKDVRKMFVQSPSFESCTVAKEWQITFKYSTTPSAIFHNCPF
ncbi:MAG TPA: hypothetical protein VI757_14035 [Bacteroidia bacterium]|nr:hypothetical protein [Bacteroidia bacterium]